MTALGFESDGVEPAAWVAVGHGTSANGNQHVHIAASLVRIDGGRVNTWQSKKVLSRVCAEVETAYDLTALEGREGRGMPGLSRAELERTAREQRAEPPRLALARIVREASVASKVEAEFVGRLRGNGVLIRPRFEIGGQDTVVGYSVALKTKDGESPVWFGGGKLARDLTLPSVRRHWDQSPENVGPAIAEWRAVKVVAPDREAILGGPDEWHRAVVGAERSVERLMAIPASDLATWRGAARETAGVFAAWSRRFEGDSPGPLAAASSALARSAQHRPDEPPPNRDAVRELRGVAMRVSQSELNSDLPVVWAMLIDQLGRTLRAIGDAHASRGEVEMAKALGGRVADELGELHDRFGTSTSRQLVPGEKLYEDRKADAIREMVARQPVHHHHHDPPSHDRGFGR
jgi:hypothetical protein